MSIFKFIIKISILFFIISLTLFKCYDTCDTSVNLDDNKGEHLKGKILYLQILDKLNNNPINNVSIKLGDTPDLWGVTDSLGVATFSELNSWYYDSYFSASLYKPLNKYIDIDKKQNIIGIYMEKIANVDTVSPSIIGFDIDWANITILFSEAMNKESVINSISIKWVCPLSSFTLVDTELDSVIWQGDNLLSIRHSKYIEVYDAFLDMFVEHYWKVVLFVLKTSAQDKANNRLKEGIDWY